MACSSETLSPAAAVQQFLWDGECAGVYLQVVPENFVGARKMWRASGREMAVAFFRRWHPMLKRADFRRELHSYLGLRHTHCAAAYVHYPDSHLPAPEIFSQAA